MLTLCHTDCLATLHVNALRNAKRSNDASVWHQGFVDRNKPVTRHLGVQGFYEREHYVKSGREE